MSGTAEHRLFSNQPGRYDRARVAAIQRLEAALKSLRLPPSRARKVGVLINALEVQVEDGGDSPEVNRLLLEALRAGIRHQVDQCAARTAIRAVDAFQEAEDLRWRQLEAGTLPPVPLAPDEQLDELMQQGYDLLASRQTVATCQVWLAAWELVKQMAGPTVTSVDQFDREWPGLTQSVFDWCQDVEMELGNAGIDDPAFHEQRVRYTREFRQRFPREDVDFAVNFARAEAEALWRLGRRAEAEGVYAALVERLPDQSWAYIGWSDQYWLDADSPRDYATAEAILQRALARPNLDERADVYERLESLYHAWGKPEQQAAAAAYRGGRTPRSGALLHLPPAAVAGSRSKPAGKTGRNAPCWCGSGRKYKHCHLGADAPAR